MRGVFSHRITTALRTAEVIDRQNFDAEVVGTSQSQVIDVPSCTALPSNQSRIRTTLSSLAALSPKRCIKSARGPGHVDLPPIKSPRTCRSLRSAQVLPNPLSPLFLPRSLVPRSASQAPRKERSQGYPQSPLAVSRESHAPPVFPTRHPRSLGEPSSRAYS